jgi:hypothetical protein
MAAAAVTTDAGLIAASGMALKVAKVLNVP